MINSRTLAIYVYCGLAVHGFRWVPTALLPNRVPGWRIPGLLSQLGTIDLFIQDSRHTERNVRFELDHAWAAVRPGGAIVVDDIDLNWGFRSFTDSVSDCQSVIGYPEPLEPDLTRFAGRGAVWRDLQISFLHQMIEPT